MRERAAGMSPWSTLWLMSTYATYARLVRIEEESSELGLERETDLVDTP
jgi:hypothetical protein